MKEYSGNLYVNEMSEPKNQTEAACGGPALTVVLDAGDKRRKKNNDQKRMPYTSQAADRGV